MRSSQVVISAIVLVAVTIATYLLLKPSSPEALCLNRLKDIGDGVTLYTADNNGYYPPYLTQSISNEAGDKVITGNRAAWAKSLKELVKSPDSFYCPNLPKKADASTPDETSYETTGVFRNQSAFGPNGTFLMNLSEAKSLEVSYLQDRLVPDIAGGRPDEFLSPHGERMSVLLYDGSVKQIPISD